MAAEGVLEIDTNPGSCKVKDSFTAVVEAKPTKERADILNRQHMLLTNQLASTAVLMCVERFNVDLLLNPAASHFTHTFATIG
eukprot:14991-Heterococcus_DN1.PRE.1